MEPVESGGIDPQFPSGPWRGYYLYRNGPDRHRMDLRLRFAGGRIDGHGIDDIAPFEIHGSYDADTLDVTFIKVYPTHTVDYRGWRDTRGIWGTWSIGPHATGGFLIWPGETGEGAIERAQESLDAPAPAGFGPGANRS